MLPSLPSSQCPRTIQRSYITCLPCHDDPFERFEIFSSLIADLRFSQAIHFFKRSKLLKFQIKLLAEYFGNQFLLFFKIPSENCFFNGIEVYGPILRPPWNGLYVLLMCSHLSLTTPRVDHTKEKLSSHTYCWLIYKQ